jgi:hypothetical protein
MKITNLKEVKDVLLEFAEESARVFLVDLEDKRKMLNDLKKSGDPTGIISEAIEFELLGKKRIPNLKKEELLSPELKMIFDSESDLLSEKFLCSTLSFESINEINKRTVDLQLEYSTGNKYSKKIDFKAGIFENIVEFNFLDIYGNLVWGFLNDENEESTDKIISETKEKLVDLMMTQFDDRLSEIEKEKPLEELMAIVNPGMSDDDYIEAVSDIDIFLKSDLSPKFIVNKKIILNFLKTAIEKDSSNLTTLKNISGNLLRVIKLPKMNRDMMDSVIKWYVDDEIRRGLFSPVDPYNNKVVLSFELDLLSKLLNGYLNKEKAEKLGSLMGEEFNKNSNLSYIHTFKIEEEDAREIFSINRGMRLTKNDLLSILSQNKFVAKDFVRKFNEVSNKKAVIGSEVKIVNIPKNVDLSFYDNLISLANNNEKFIINCGPDEKKNIKRSLERLMLVSYKGINSETIKDILSCVEFDLILFDI